jgi:hypothetical protein
MTFIPFHAGVSLLGMLSRNAQEVSIMKRLLLMTLMLGALALSGSVLPSVGKAGAPHRETALIEFPEQVKLSGVFLRGQYLIVHDHEMMARGEDCTYVYRQKAGQPDKLVVSFHCIPVARKTADHFTVVAVPLPGPMAIREVREIQFAGSDEGHQVP